MFYLSDKWRLEKSVLNIRKYAIYIHVSVIDTWIITQGQLRILSYMLHQLYKTLTS